MYKFFLNEINNKKGITLMEILIIVIVLSVLVAVAVPIFFRNGNHANEETCKANREIIYNAIDSAIVNELYVGNDDSIFLTDGSGTHSFCFHHKESEEQSFTTVTGEWDALFNKANSRVGSDPVKFFGDAFFNGALPYCPKGDDVYETDLTVSFAFDDDGDPYICRISCEHGSTDYPAP